MSTMNTIEMASTQAPVAVDEGDLLHAVMAFLEDNDAIEVMGETSDSNGSSVSDNESRKDSSSPVVGTSKQPPVYSGVLPPLQPRRPKVNRSRERMREEIVRLREQVLELQDHLESVKGGVTSRVGIFPKAKPNENEQEMRHLRALAWQALAKYESGKASAAEVERERLRALLKEQKLAFRRLRRYLGKYSADSQWAAIQSRLVLPGERVEQNDAVDPKPPATTSFTKTARPPPPPSKLDFEEVSRAIPAMYLQTTAVFNDERLESLTSSVRDLKIQNEMTPRMSIEALDSRVVPFDVQQTGDAVWQFHLRKIRVLSATKGQVLEETDECIRRTYESVMKDLDVNNIAHVRMETRRFREQERVVIVQSALFDGVRMKGVEIPNFALRQYQWTVIGPPRNFLLRHSGKPMAQVEVFEVMVPVVDHVTGVDKHELLETVRNMCQSTALVHLEMERESVESILMDTVLKDSALDSSMLRTPSTVW